MKKLFRLFAVMFACFATTAVTASAAGTQASYCAIANGILQDGYSVSVTVSTKDLCDGFQGDFKYDAQKYTLLTEDGTYVKKVSDGVLKLASVGNISAGNSEWITLSFKAATPGLKEDFLLENAKAVLHNSSNSSPVESNTFLLGDANDNNSIDIVDLVRLKKVVAQAEGVTVTLGADCNRDGNYNADDLIPLKKYLLGVNGVHFGK